MRLVAALAKKESRRVLRDKSFIFITASQLMLLSLSITFTQFLPLFIAGDVGMPHNFAKVGVASDGMMLTAFLNDSRIYETVGDQPGLVFYETGIYDGFITSPGFSGAANGTEPILVRAYMRDGPKYPTLMARSRRVLARIEDDVRRDRTALHGLPHTEYSIERADGAQSDIIYTVLLPLFLTFVSVIGGNLYITLISAEHEEGTIDVLLSTPARYLDIVASKALAAFTIVISQFLLWIAVFEVTDVEVAHPLLMAVYGGAAILFFICLGMVSYRLAPTRDSAQNIYALFILPPVALLLPFGALPDAYSALSALAPSNVLANIALSPALPLGTEAAIAAMIASVLSLLALALSASKRPAGD